MNAIFVDRAALDQKKEPKQSTAETIQKPAEASAGFAPFSRELRLDDPNFRYTHSKAESSDLEKRNHAMNRRIAISLGIAVLITLQTLVALAEDPNPNGRPKEFKEGSTRSYAIWIDNGVWKLRTTSTALKNKQNDEGVVFTGSVRAEGGKLIGERGNVEKAKNIAKADLIVEHKDGQGFDFRFATFGQIDGVNWTLGEGATAVKFKLLINGKEEPVRIFIGNKGEHPEKAEFTIAVPSPDKEKKQKKSKDKSKDKSKEK